jgi:hypothetical protein
MAEFLEDYDSEDCTPEADDVSGMGTVDAPKALDGNEVVKLLDNGWQVLIFRNELTSYTAIARHPNRKSEIVTDDFTVPKVLHRITEKVFGNIVIVPRAK